MTNIKSPRNWTPYELSQLARVGLTDLTQSVTSEMPVEYLTGQVDFCGWQVKVSPAVLIPRVETEQLIELALAALAGYVQPLINIVEVGTGSGAIGLSFWRILTNRSLTQTVELTLMDISSPALQIAQENLLKLETEFKPQPNLPYPQLKLSNLLTNWPKNQPIDLLLANLPYIPSANLADLPESVSGFEPKLALDGGVDGLRLIDQLLSQAKTFLTPAGQVILEVDESHTLNQFKALRPEYVYQGHLDCFGKSRFITAKLKS